MADAVGGKARLRTVPQGGSIRLQQGYFRQVKRDQWPESVLEASRRLMTWLHFLKDCTEADKMRNVWIQ